ncbi:PREDICTED: E3 ubiquitin-protein ligase TM129 [Myotis davidii]|uniref:E3 ubiquitin-protein ligase TM129 n=1 Tax=Myotis davidii TaxID=225400 RepID=UPI0003EC621B|nr:PREDICTED: E3 ubiquitin-protein ligase TM129 [Myotis davidii]
MISIATQQIVLRVGTTRGGRGPGSPTSTEAAPSPAGYYVGMCFAASEKRLYSPSQAPETWRLFLLLAVTLPTISWTLIYYWSRDRWARHPLSRTLALYALPQSGWQAVASSVNTEFRRIDKFATGAPGARVIVTDTWVMKVTTYRVHVAQQQDVHLTVTESQQHELSPDSNLPVQLLTIRVASTIPAVQAFDIRLNSTEYGEVITYVPSAAPGPGKSHTLASRPQALSTTGWSERKHRTGHSPTGPPGSEGDMPVGKAEGVLPVPGGVAKGQCQDPALGGVAAGASDS